MNKERRKAIADIISGLRAKSNELDDIKGAIDSLKGELETAKDEEQDYLDAMPESFQQGDKGSKAEEAISALDDADTEIADMVDKIDEAITALNDVVWTLEEAVGKVDEVESNTDRASE